MSERTHSRDDRSYRSDSPQQVDENSRERQVRWQDHEGDHSSNEFDERFAHASRDMRESFQPQFERGGREWSGGRGDEWQRRRGERDHYPRNQSGSERSRPYDRNFDLAQEQKSKPRSRPSADGERWGHYPSGRLSPAFFDEDSQSGGWDYEHSQVSGRRHDDDLSRMRGQSDRQSSRSSAADQSSPAPVSARGKGPKGYQRSDERIREEVCDELTRHHAIDASHMEVEVNQAEVTLKGYVQRRQEKYLAEDLCEGIMGVKEVHNLLRVGQDSSRSQAVDRNDTANKSNQTQAQL